MNKIIVKGSFKILTAGIFIVFLMSCFTNMKNGDNSIKWHEYKWDTTATGLFYHISISGLGEVINDTETVNLKYVWFDFQSKKQKFVGTSNGQMNSGVIDGFRQARQCLKNKGAGYFKIPRKLYNNATYANNENFLLYYLEVIDCPYRK